MIEAIKAIWTYIKNALVTQSIPNAIGKGLADLCVFTVSIFWNQIKIWTPKIFLLIEENTILLIDIITISLLIYLIFLTRKNNQIIQTEKEKQIQLENPEPEIIFADKIIFRKEKSGPRTKKNLSQQFALAIKIGVKNEVEIFDTRMTLLHMRYKKEADSNTIERDGVEEYITSVNYVDLVHRYNFYADELSYKTLKPISEMKGEVNDDQIVIILTGYYGKNSTRRFLRKHSYSFNNIVFADKTAKVVNHRIHKDKREDQKPKAEWEKLNEVTSLSTDECERRKEELKKVIDEKYVKPEQTNSSTLDQADK